MTELDLLRARFVALGGTVEPVHLIVHNKLWTKS